MKFDKTIYNNSKFSEPVPCNCTECGQIFWRNKKSIYISISRNSDNLFCSKQCHGNFTKTAKNPIQCLHCGNHTKYPNKFCNRNCYFAFKRKNSQIKKCRGKASKIIVTSTNSPKIKKSSYKKQFTSNKKPKSLRQLECEQCHTPFTRAERKNEKNKHGFYFCNKSCRMKYFNIKHNVARSSGQQTSFPENYLFEKLIQIFPDDIIQKNVRDVLSCGYEIDIFFPKNLIAIEVNGPTHYHPIYGPERLQKVQFKDSIKYAEMTDKKISYIILNVSHSLSKKKMIEYIERELMNNIIPIIQAHISTKEQ